FSPRLCFTESDQFRDSKDFIAVLKKPKIENLDQHELDWERDDQHELDWERDVDRPMLRKELGACAMPTWAPETEKYPRTYAATTEPKVKVHFLGLKKEYEKVQSRVNRQSRQRLADGKVRIMIKTEAQIEHIGVYVERIPMAAALSGDVTGRVPLNVKLGAQMINKQFLSVDLDSVYMSSQGTPVYKLSTVDADRRNRFRLIVTVLFIDGEGSRSFASPPFLLRSRRPERKKSC
ncbi:unnamed protein product, partial [Porites lobata]